MLDFLLTSDPGAPLRLAFEVLGGLHDVADRHPRIIKGISRKSCIFSARASARFLQQVGFAARTSCCVLFVIEFDASRKPIGTEKIGEFTNSGHLRHDGGWEGHMVVMVDGFLFDPTAGQIKTERVPSMIATPERHTMLKGQSTLSAVAVTRNQRHLQLYWLEAPGSSLREEIGVAQQAIEDVAHTLAAIYNSRNSNAVVPRSTSNC